MSVQGFLPSKPGFGVRSHFARSSEGMICISALTKRIASLICGRIGMGSFRCFSYVARVRSEKFAMRANVSRFKPVARLHEYKAVPLLFASFELTARSLIAALIINYFAASLRPHHLTLDKEFVWISQVFREHDYIC